MGVFPVQVLRVIIWISLLGSLVVQVVIVPSARRELSGPDGGGVLSVLLAVIAVLAILGLQVIGWSILRLLSLMGRGQVLSPRALGHVDRIVAAVAGEAVLVFAVAVLASIGNRMHPGDELAPGAVGMICGIALVIAGFALVARLQRRLLVQFAETAARLRELEAELDGMR